MKTRQKQSDGVVEWWSDGNSTASAPLHYSITPLLRSRNFPRAFSLIELIGVLAVMAILAGVVAPALIRHMDKVAGHQESAALKSFGDALQQSILRARSIPT